MTSIAGQRIDDLVRIHVHPVLKLAGFRRSNRTWNRAIGDLVHVVNIQASQWNDGDRGSSARSRWNVEPCIRVGVDTGDAVSGT